MSTGKLISLGYPVGRKEKRQVKVIVEMKEICITDDHLGKYGTI